ncbi:methyltransferase domain-containing protein [Gallaecimonas sp. GXIMD4217]|uniref:methyltransferase domain-containing protein n=1 Tax=Gallaecimonas sp. GXIMD4217 TaxID=3131927 RepID=UPI00311B1074
MKSHPLTVPQDWQALVRGDWLRDQESLRLSQWWSRIFGYYMLKLGPLAAGLDCSGARMSRQWSLCGQGQADIFGSGRELPIQSRSVDALLLSHNLEYCEHPHQLMREANRILVPDGHMIITGFNPLSMTGTARLWRREPPFNGRFLTAWRVKDWLKLLGYEVLDEERFLFGSLAGRTSGWQWLDTFGENYAPWLGGLYLILARKRQRPLTPIFNLSPVRKMTASGVPGAISGRVGPANPVTRQRSR